MTFAYILISTFAVSAISLIGIFTLSLSNRVLTRITIFLVALSAGALMGGAFLHLIPESAEHSHENPHIFIWILIGFSLFFLIEKVFRWQHCHKEKCSIHTFAYMNLIGEIVHNFIDGLIIAAGFLVSPALGITTTLAVALHEIPQEIGDFGVLVHAGFTKVRAITLNFLVALTAILGGIVGYYLGETSEWFKDLLIPLTAGGFIYIAACDLIPEIRKETALKKSFPPFLVFIAGIAIMYALTLLEIGHTH